MQEIIEYKGWIVAGAFLLLFGLEHICPAAKAGLHPVKRILKNLSFWPINIGLSLAFILPVTYWAAQHALWERPQILGGIAGLALDILILDLFIYWWHRAVHEMPFFWRFHEVHHLDEHLDTTSAIRFHFGEIFFATFVRAAVVIVFAVPFTSVVIFEVLVLAFTLFHHSNIALPPRLEKPLSKIIITPSIHWVHHHAIRKDTDSNYGTIFSFWDILFRSKSKTNRFVNMRIGVEGRTDGGFLKLLLSPFISR
ncbi:MAG: sterol desaturase family protein [Alphaproteobacteria bacterium]|nr:sterol desaturase family protein [Alphaproteobacteria bacterium]